jgi:DNA-binding PadR family transcriptional regulator
VSLPHALLGLLAVQPASGYELTKEFDRELGRYAWQAGHTSIYPELNRLAERGLVVVTDSGPRGRRTYEVTGAGREELRSWLLTPPANGGVVRNEQVLRMFLISALEPADARRVLRRIAEHTGTAAAELRGILGSEPDAGRGARAGFGRLAAEFGVRQYDAAHEWALWALDQLPDPPAPEAAPENEAEAEAEDEAAR